MSRLPTTTDPRPDPGFCPLCGQPNVCAMELAERTGQPQPPCWCMAVVIDAATLAQIPAPAQGLACICARCAAQPPQRTNADSA